MNQPTITGSTDSNGLFRAENTFSPYSPKHAAGTDFSEFDWFSKSHPPLFCYNENNDLVKGVEGLEVKGPCYQFLSEDWSSGKKIQTWVNGNDGDRPFPTYKSYSKYWNDRKFETRQVYIAVQPTEKAETLTSNTFFDMATFSDVPIVNEYFKDIKSMYHDAKITIAIEKFALWLENKNSPKPL